MKNRIAIVFVLLILAACSKEGKKNEDGLLTGKWKLIEQLADPGDGSGVFAPVNSNKTITFFNDGTWESNGPLCFMTIGSNGESTGTYSTTDSTITVDGCNSSAFDITFEFEDSDLILNYPCFEPCRQKYVKI